MLISGEIKHIDHLILTYILARPEATHREIAQALNMAQGNITRRMQSPAFLKARSLFEGTISDKMRAAADKFARYVNTVLDGAEGDLRTALDKLTQELGGDADARKAALSILVKRSDPSTVLEAGKVAVNFMTKEAEISLKNREVEVKERAVPMEPQEAARILAADVTRKEDVKVTVPSLDDAETSSTH